MACDILVPLSTIAQDDFFLSALGLVEKMFAYTPHGFARRCTHLLERNWLMGLLMKVERKRLAGKKKSTSLEIYVYLPYGIILEVRTFYSSLIAPSH